MPITPGTECNDQYIDYVYKQASVIKSNYHLKFSYGEPANDFTEQNGDILYGHLVDVDNSDFYIVGIDAKTLELLFSKKIHFPPHPDPHNSNVNEFPQGIYPAGNGAFHLYYEGYNLPTRREVLFSPTANRDGIDLVFDLEILADDEAYADPSAWEKPFGLVYNPVYGAFFITKHYNHNSYRWERDLFRILNGTVSHIISFGTENILYRLALSNNYIVSWWGGLFVYNMETQTYWAKNVEYLIGESYESVRVPYPLLQGNTVYGVVQNDSDSHIFAFDSITNVLRRMNLLSYYGDTITNTVVRSDLPVARSVTDSEILIALPARLTLKDSNGNSTERETVTYFYKNASAEILKATNFGNIEQPFFADAASKRTTLLEYSSSASDYYVFYPIKYTESLDLCYCASPIEYEWKNLTSQITDVIPGEEPPIHMNFLSEITIEDFDFSWNTVYEFTWCGSHPLFTPFARTFTPYGADIRLARGGVV